MNFRETIYNYSWKIVCRNFFDLNSRNKHTIQSPGSDCQRALLNPLFVRIQAVEALFDRIQAPHYLAIAPICPMKNNTFSHQFGPHSNSSGSFNFLFLLVTWVLTYPILFVHAWQSFVSGNSMPSDRWEMGTPIPLSLFSDFCSSHFPRDTWEILNGLTKILLADISFLNNQCAHLLVFFLWTIQWDFKCFLDNSILNCRLNSLGGCDFWIFGKQW